MKSHVFRRGLAVVAVYAVVALSLVLVQFSRNTGFTFNVGSIAVTGKYARESSDALGRADRALSGPLALYFGGMEFRLSESDGLVSVRDGKALSAKPASISLLDDGLKVRFSDDTEVRFSAMFIGGEETLRATASFGRGTSELRIPYRPIRSSRVADLGNGRTAIVSGGDSYAFSSAAVNPEKRYVSLKASAPVFAYGKIVPKKGFSPSDYISPQGGDLASFDSARGKWVDQTFTAWERAMSANPSEELIVAYTAESARRGNYRSAVATAPKSFVDAGERGFRAAAFYGRVDEGFRSLLAAERETLGRISRLENERNVDLFVEPDLISYVSLRASKSVLDDIAVFAKTLDPAATTASLAVGYIECWTEWSLLKSDQPNPFDKLVDQARFVLSGMFRKTGDGAVFLVSADKADTAFNLRAARALIRSSAVSKDRTWGDLGRTLILSSLALSDASGSLPADVSVPDRAEAAVPGTARLPSALVYRLVAGDSLLPRAVPLLAESGSTLWAWTAASCSAVRAENVIDVSVDFAVGESHFMILRGVKPFVKIQLYGIDFSTDERFERYDSSGWAYSASEQSLLLKMKHKSGTEHIKIFY